MGNSPSAKRKWLRQYINGNRAAWRQQCLAYYQEELKLKVFQEKEADSYHETAEGNGILSSIDSEAAVKMLPTVVHRAEALNEILKRRGKIVGVPDTGAAMYFAWQVAYSDYLSWAIAQAAAVSELANGIVPHVKRLNRLRKHSEKHQRKAEREEKRFKTRVNITDSELRTMLIKASMEIVQDNWQPESHYKNEVGHLSQRIYQLEASSAQYKQTLDEITRQHYSMEELVKERTSEMREITRQLKQELSEHRQTEEQMTYAATHDSLTGLPNRALFHDRLTITLAYAQRNHLELALLMLDIDQFKEINDKMGHNVGDQLLKDVGERLLRVLRQSDTAARMGGDEFILLLQPTTTTQNAETVAHRVQAAFRKPFIYDAHEINVTASIGIVIYPVAGEDADTLIKNVDTAMYSAKKQGGDRYQFWTN